MKLADYLEAENLTLKQFGDKIGRTEATVSRLARGLNKPDQETLDAILRETGGRVTANDFWHDTSSTEGVVVLGTLAGAHAEEVITNLAPSTIPGADFPLEDVKKPKREAR